MMCLWMRWEWSETRSACTHMERLGHLGSPAGQPEDGSASLATPLVCARSCARNRRRASVNVSTVADVRPHLQSYPRVALRRDTRRAEQ